MTDCAAIDPVRTFAKKATAESGFCSGLALLAVRDNINGMEENAMTSRKIRCGVRCLEPETVRAAKREMGGAATGKVPFVCKMSGEKEDILLLSEESARRLASLPNPIGGPLTQKIVYAISGAALCECDIATLTERGEDEVLDELARLQCAGIVKCREIEGMNYYKLSSADVANALAGRLAALGSP